MKQTKLAQGHSEEAKDIEKQLRKQIRKERRLFLQHQLEEMDEQGYRWHGLKRLRKTYSPSFTKFRDMHGKKDFPEKAAEYFAKVQWKCPDTMPSPHRPSLTTQGQATKNTAWEAAELDTVIEKLPGKKAPGPDNIPSLYVKWLDQANRSTLLNLYNSILLDGKYYESLSHATIAPIYKKGDPAKLENYRPIVLLQTFYKILASLIKIDWSPRWTAGFQKPNMVLGGVDPQFNPFLSLVDYLISLKDRGPIYH